jgi:protein-S-isoprenylcysteine O-methyltransferase Ste14
VALLLKNLTFTALVPGTVAGLVPWALTREHALAHGLLLVLAAALLTVGLAIYAWCVWDFASFGRGTPAPIDAPRNLVERGLYRYSRNPMYVGVLTTIASWSVGFRSPEVAVYGCGVALCFHLFVVLYEEPHLARQFGGSYEAYRTRVGRWISLPGRA